MATTEISISPEMIAEAVRRAMASLGESNGHAAVATKPTTGKLDAKKDYPLGRQTTRPGTFGHWSQPGGNHAGKSCFRQADLRRRQNSPRNPGVSGADCRKCRSSAPGA